MAERRPFHETIIDAIGHVDRTNIRWFVDIFIKATKISENHDAIIATWRRRLLALNICNKYDVPAILLRQKQEAEVEAEAQARAESTERQSQTNIGGGDSCMAIEHALQHEKVCPSDPLRPR